MGTGTNIAYYFLFGIPVIDKAKIQLIAEKRTPWIGAGTTKKNEIIVGLKAGKLHASGGMYIDSLCMAERKFRDSDGNWGVDQRCLVSAQENLSYLGDLGCQFAGIKDVVVIGVVGNGDGLSGVSLNLGDVRIAGNELQRSSRI